MAKLLHSLTGNTKITQKVFKNTILSTHTRFLGTQTTNKLEGVFLKTSLWFSKTILVLFLPTSTFLPKMPKNKKQKVPDRPLPPLYSAEDIPSQDCKDFLIELIVRYYEEFNLRSLESTYVRYRDEGPEMFKHDMHVRMTEHLMVLQWNDDYQKRGRSKFVDARVHNSLWNAPNILAKYGREHRAGDDAFNDMLLKADLFVAQMRPFAKSRNRRGSIG